MTIQSILDGLNTEEWNKIHQVKNAVVDIIKDDVALQQFCSDFTYLRYLRARNFHVDKAIKMLKGTIEWRKSFKPDQLRWKDVKHEGETGKIFRLPAMDKHGRPVLVLRSRKENTKAGMSQLRHVVYHVELACRMADKEGATGKMTLIIDYVGYSWATAPSSKQGIQVLNILQNHYPERLGFALMYHAPKILSVFWAAISPFIDPVTYKKILFVNKGDKKERSILEENFDVSQLEESLGGDYAGEYFNLEQYTQKMEKEEEMWYGEKLPVSNRRNNISFQNGGAIAAVN